MIINKIKSIFVKDENKGLQMFIEKVNKNDELRAMTYANRTIYVNPSVLRLS